MYMLSLKMDKKFLNETGFKLKNKYRFNTIDQIICYIFYLPIVLIRCKPNMRCADLLPIWLGSDFKQ